MAETFLLPNLCNANKLPDLYLVILSQLVLEIHMISCLSAAPQGRKRKGANCAALVYGGSRERSCCLPAVFRAAAISCLPAFACLCLSFPVSYIVLYCLVPSFTSCPLSVPVCFLIFELLGPVLDLPACWDCL